MRILLLGLQSGRLGQYKAVNRVSVNVTVLDHKLRLLLGALQRDENKTTFDAQESMVSGIEGLIGRMRIRDRTAAELVQAAFRIH